MSPGGDQSDCGCGHDDSGQPSSCADPFAVYTLPHRLGVVGDHHDEYEQWRSEQYMDDGRPEQRFNRIDSIKIHGRANKSRRGNEPIELFGVFRSAIEDMFPAEGFANRIRA